MFRRSIARGRLSHSFLFVGADGIGKKLFARTLAQCLFCQRFSDTELDACGECSACKQVAAGTHPDFYVIGRPEGKSVLPIELIAGDTDRRGREGLCYELSRRPMAGHRKIAIIDDAGLMNQESANAFLKTLEEPPPHSLLMLLATNVDALLPTIRSRCQLVRFHPLSADDVSELLVEQEQVADREEADAIAALSDGSLATALQLLDPALRSIRESLYERLGAEQFRAQTTAADMLAALEEIGGDSVAQRQAAVWIVRFCAEFYRGALLRLCGDDRRAAANPAQVFASHIDSQSPEGVERVAAMVERTMQAEDQLEAKASAPLCFEALFDDLGRLHRAAVQH
jgi:DNA polymerase-3 subunit delta'